MAHYIFTRNPPASPVLRNGIPWLESRILTSSPRRGVGIFFADLEIFLEILKETFLFFFFFFSFELVELAECFSCVVQIVISSYRNFHTEQIQGLFMIQRFVFKYLSVKGLNKKNRVGDDSCVEGGWKQFRTRGIHFRTTR